MRLYELIQRLEAIRDRMESTFVNEFLKGETDNLIDELKLLSPEIGRVIDSKSDEELLKRLKDSYLSPITFPGPYSSPVAPMGPYSSPIAPMPFISSPSPNTGIISFPSVPGTTGSFTYTSSSYPSNLINLTN